MKEVKEIKRELARIKEDYEGRNESGDDGDDGEKEDGGEEEEDGEVDVDGREEARLKKVKGDAAGPGR